MIEYFGLKNVNRKYTANLQRKLVIVKKKKLNLIALYPEDLSETQLAEKLQTKAQSFCHMLVLLI